MVAHTPSTVLVAEYSSPNENSENACSYHVSKSVAFAGVISPDTDNDDGHTLPTIPSVQGESIADVHYDTLLEQNQRKDLETVFVEFTDTLTDKPGTEKGDVFHEVNLTTDTPVRLKPYPLPFASR